MTTRSDAGRAVGPALLVCAAAALFGTIGTARALGPEQAGASAVTLVRLAVAISLMWLVVAVTRRGGGIRPVLRKRAVWGAGMAQAVFQVSFLASITRVGVATGTLVAIGVTPLLTGLFQVVRYRRLARMWVLATCCGLVGLALLVGIGDRADAAGLLLALLSAMAYASYITLGTQIGARGLDPTVVLPVIFTVAAAVQLPSIVLADWSWLATSSGRWMIAYLALLPTVLAYALFNRGLGRIDPATASTLGLIEPLVATVLAVLVLDESLAAVQVVGAVLVGIGVVLAARTAAPAPVTGA